MGKRSFNTVNGATNFHRPPYEGISAIAWLVGAIVNIVVARTIGHGVAIVGYAAIPMLAISIYQFVLTWNNWSFKARLTSALPPWIPVRSVIRKQQETNETFLGKGFEWEPKHARLMKEISNIAVRRSFEPPPAVRRLMIALGLISSYRLEGKHYIHGSGGGEEDLFVSKQSRRSHTLVLGTNGAGKTRLLETLVTQSISRGWIPERQQDARQRFETKLNDAKHALYSLPEHDGQADQAVVKAKLVRRIQAIQKKLNRMPTLEIGPVFILDPKGDPDLRDRAYATAKLFGREKQFEYFSPTDALYSFRVNPLANFSRLTELANRISALLPSGGDSEAFKQFAWRAINVVLEGLDYCDKPINIPNLRNFVESGIEGLLIPCLELHFRRHQSEFKKEFRDWESKVRTTSNRMKDSGSLDKEAAKYASALASFYVTNIKATHPNTTIDGMIDVTLHDTQHYNKLISNLVPVLVQLTTGDMGRLLSNADFPGEARPSTSFQAMIDNNAIVYINFESLADSVVGAALGSLFIADLTACAAARHHKGLSEPPVAIYIDEAAEMMNEPFIQALNKGRAAGFELTLASQTIADFEARMGNKAKALQVLSNVNTTIAMRLQDNDSIRMVTDKFAETSYEEKTSSRTSTTIAAMEGRGRDFSGSVMKNSQVSDLSLVTPDMLSSLPAGHFFGHLPGGRKVKGRVLMMPMDDCERYSPAMHGKISTRYSLGDNVGTAGDGTSALEQVELLRLDPDPAKRYDYHTSHLRLPKADNRRS